MYVKVALPLPIYTTFTYKVPANYEPSIKCGCRVKVKFRGKQFYGFVVDIGETKDIEYEPSEIVKLIDNIPLIKSHLWEIAEYISEYYLVSFGSALEIVLPQWVKLLKIEEEEKDAKEVVVTPPPYELTPYQKEALNVISGAYKNQDSLKKFLIWGMTGSGKTEIYLKVLEEMLKLNKSSIYIVPEIALTPQIVERITTRFGNKVVIFHSKLTQSERRKNWCKLFLGKVKIVIGTRSAIFAPVDNLGVVVIDEEHENTLKSEQAPRFNLKDIAYKLCELTNAILILGSATPSVETYYKALSGEIKIIHLPERINRKPLPKIEIVDISKEKTNIFGISTNLVNSIKNAIEKNEQVLLFINRRGYATFIRCAKCFFVLKCPRCSIAISYHKKEGKLKCHHCNFEIEPFVNCPSCGLGVLKMLGFGSQRIEEFVQKTFGIGVIRMDSDQKWDYSQYQKAFELLKSQGVKILVGTQMVAKGFDFPDMTIVGILGIDTLMAMSDFRVSERIFQLVIQVAGRCGRADKEGLVFVETLNPHHPSLIYAQNYDFETFYRTELETRQILRLPPYVFLTAIVVEGKIYDNVYKKINDLKLDIQTKAKELSIDCEIEGPGQPQYKKLKNFHRFQLLLKTSSHRDSVAILKHFIHRFSYSKTLRVIVDPDPIDIL